jgi:deoxyadenosine/deoxycytidine kinase
VQAAGGGDLLLKVPRRPRFIAVEGPTGVGKSTLVRRLPSWLSADPIFDPFDANPFFGATHESSGGTTAARSALPAELTFLALRIAQLREIAAMLAAGRSIVADWALAKQPIFAALTLGEVDRDRIARTCAIWADDLPRPDLLIYLRADARILRERIAGRGRAIEAEIDEAYLTLLCGLFDSELSHYPGPVMIVDAAPFDVFDDEAVAKLASRIQRELMQREESRCA